MQGIMYTLCNSETFLYPWNETNLNIMYDLSDKLLILICKHVLRIFPFLPSRIIALQFSLVVMLSDFSNRYFRLNRISWEGSSSFSVVFYVLMISTLVLENTITFSKYAFALLPISPLFLCVVTFTYTYALLHTMILVFFYDLRSISTGSLEVWINSGAWDVVQLVGCLPAEYKVLGFNPQFCVNWHVNASRSKVQGHPQLYIPDWNI